MPKTKETKRTARHKRIRKKLRGASNRPRLCVHRSLKNIQAQLVDDVKSVTILSLSTLAKEVKEKNSFGGNIKAAQALGEALAALAVKKGIQEIIFDRCGYVYHGRVKALAEALRKGGLVF